MQLHLRARRDMASSSSAAIPAPVFLSRRSSPCRKCPSWSMAIAAVQERQIRVATRQQKMVRGRTRAGKPKDEWSRLLRKSKPSTGPDLTRTESLSTGTRAPQITLGCIISEIASEIGIHGSSGSRRLHASAAAPAPGLSTPSAGPDSFVDASRLDWSAETVRPQTRMASSAPSVAAFLSTLPEFQSTPRIQSLYSDLSRQKLSNPTGYTANLEWWRKTLTGLTQQRLQPQPDSLVLHVDQGLSDAFRWDKVGRPLGLGVVIVSAGCIARWRVLSTAGPG